MSRLLTLILIVSACGFTACQDTETAGRKKKPAPPPPPGMENQSTQPWNRPTKASEMGGTPFGMPQSY